MRRGQKTPLSERSKKTLARRAVGGCLTSDAIDTRPSLTDAALPPRVTVGPMPGGWNTGRRPGRALAKAGEMVSGTYRAWIWTQLCAHCSRRPATEPQHYPTTGSNGVKVDLLSYPTCRECHGRCDMSPTNGGFTAAEKAVALHDTWKKLERLYPDALRQILRELAGPDPLTKG